MSPFQNPDEKFFQEPVKFADWTTYLNENPRATDAMKLRNALAIAAEVSESSVRHYLHPDRYRKLAQATVNRLDDLTQALGQPLPNRDRPPRQLRRIALFWPSVVRGRTFHLEMIRRIASEAQNRRIGLTIHELGGRPGQATHVQHVLETVEPDAAIMMRLTPSPPTLKLLAPAKHEADDRIAPIPLVLVHADCMDYGFPVIRHVIPRQDVLAEQLAGWLSQRPHIREKIEKNERLQIVFCAVGDEPRPSTTDTSQRWRSIRNHRKQEFRKAILQVAGLSAASSAEQEAYGSNYFYQNLDDYAFHRAYEIWKRHTDADAFVCLSDDLAVAFKQLVQAYRRGTGTVNHAGQPDTRDMVIGFDNSDVARAEGIASFRQEFDETAVNSVEAIQEFYEPADRDTSDRPQHALEKETSIYLVQNFA